MRGKTKLITFHPASFARDDLGRRTRVSTPGTEIRGAASTPRLSKSTTPAGERIDLVVHVPARGFMPLDEHMVEVEGVGQFTILSIAGGRRIWRIDLARFQRKDHSSGRF